MKSAQYQRIKLVIEQLHTTILERIPFKMYVKRKIISVLVPRCVARFDYSRVARLLGICFGLHFYLSLVNLNYLC